MFCHVLNRNIDAEIPPSITVAEFYGFKYNIYSACQNPKEVIILNFLGSNRICVSAFRSRNGNWGWCIDYLLGDTERGWGGGQIVLDYVRTEKEGAETAKMAAANGLKFLKEFLKSGMKRSSRWKKHNFKPLVKSLDREIKRLTPRYVQMNIFDYTSETLNFWSSDTTQ